MLVRGGSLISSAEPCVVQQFDQVIRKWWRICAGDGETVGLVAIAQDEIAAKRFAPGGQEKIFLMILAPSIILVARLLGWLWSAFVPSSKS